MNPQSGETEEEDEAPREFVAVPGIMVPTVLFAPRRLQGEGIAVAKFEEEDPHE